MNVFAASILATAGVAIGAALSGAAFIAGSLPPAAGAAGIVLLVAAAGLEARTILRASTAAAAVRERIGAATVRPGERPLPEPFETISLIALEHVGELVRQRDAKAADARRARLTARAMQNEHAALTGLLDNLSDGVLLFDSARTPTIANRAARRFLGVVGEEPLDADLALLVKRPQLRPPLERALSGTDRAALATRDVDVSDPAERLVLRVSFQEIATDAVAGAPDAPPPMAVLIRDVTREVELNRMKSDFASSVSHELKTPLCSMRAFLEMIIDGDIEGEEAQKEHLKVVLDQTDRLTRLIQNLLNLSRLEAGITKMARDPVALPDVLRHLEDVTTPLAQARSQSLSFEVSPFLPPVTGDPALLEQAILNLISNAIKYTPEGGTISVFAGLAGRSVDIRVVDTGVGIPPQALDLVFEKFTRIENQAGLKATGTGLGLPLAKFVAEAHGGTIKLKSEVGKGSEFKMVLPLRRATDSGEAVLVGLEGMGR